MAILRRQFYYHEKGNHNETWHWLARNTETGRVFVINGFAPMGREEFETETELAEFLATNNSTARTNLLKLIGTLVEEEGA